MPLPLLNPNLQDFWMTKAKIRILRGGRTSSKTHDMAGNAVRIASAYNAKFLCVRQFQNRIDDSVYTVIKNKVDAFGYNHYFKILKSSIVNNDTDTSFHFYGIQRNILEIKGFEGANILWIEEAESLTQAQWEVLEPTVIRNQGYEIWISYNPRFSTDFIESSPIFKHDPANGVISRTINYDENIYLNEDALTAIERLRVLDEDSHRHIYLGETKDDDSLSFVKLEWLESCIDAHIVLDIEPDTTKARVGFDVADGGEDNCAKSLMLDWVITYVDEWDLGPEKIEESSKEVFDFAVTYDAEIDYDSNGVGAGCASFFKRFNEEGKVNGEITSDVAVHKFVAQASVIDKDEVYFIPMGKGFTKPSGGKKNIDQFENLAAQQWQLFANKCKNTYNAVNHGVEYDTKDMISFSSEIKDLQGLFKELHCVRAIESKNGKTVREDKEKMKKERGISSPNRADAVIMCQCSRERKRRGIASALAKKNTRHRA